MAKQSEQLNPQELKFCELFAGGKSQTQAYMEAFNLPEEKRDYASCAASRLMKKPKIHDMALKCQADVYERMCLNAEKIAIKLADMAFAEKDDEIYGASVQLKALDMLQKQLGLQKQNIKADVDTTTQIKVTVDDE